MGYQTDFEGQFGVEPTLSKDDKDYLHKFAKTRRMARDVSKLEGDPKKYGFESWGVEGEFYVDGTGDFGQGHEDSITSRSSSASTQPGLWCEWEPNEAGDAIEWNGSEKFYDYVEWLQYLIKEVLAPRGYKLNGEVRWQGEEMHDCGVLTVQNNDISTRELR